MSKSMYLKYYEEDFDNSFAIWRVDTDGLVLISEDSGNRWIKNVSYDTLAIWTYTDDDIDTWFVLTEEEFFLEMI